MNITPLAPLDYERYAALYGLVAVPVEERLSVRPPQGSTLSVAPVNAAVDHRQDPSAQNKAEEFNSALSKSQKTPQKQVIVTDQELTDTSWLAEYASGAMDAGAWSDRPSSGKVAGIYSNQRDTSPQIFRQSG